MNLKSITFPGLEEEYSIQLTAEDVGARPDTWMPTATEVGAAPSGFGYGEGLVNIGNANDDATFVVALAEQFNSINNKTKQIMFNYGGSAFIGTLWNAGNNYGTLVANSYVEPNVAYRFKQLVRICNNGTWGAWVDNSPTAFAPSGYGIGKLVNYEVTSDTEIDNVLISTIASMEGHSFKRIVLSFKSTTNFTNGGGHYYTDIYKLSTNYAMITIKSYINDGKTMQRTWFEGALKPWEWVNPSMFMGTEYRTTERWQGKAVYKRLGSYTFTEGFGDASTVSNVVVSFGHISATQILSAEMVLNAPATEDRGYIVPITAASGGLLSVNTVLNNGGAVLISNKYAVSAGSVMYCTLRYTKD